MWTLIKDLAGLGLLLPHLAGVVVEAVMHTVATIRIVVRPRSTSATCPRCGITSVRVHARYARLLADLALGGRAVEVEVRARRWLCNNDACQARTFAEQIDGLTARHARQTPPLLRALEYVGLALAGRAGARLAKRLGMATSRSTLLRRVRALPDPPRASLTVVGVDDFAVRRGHRYGTVVVDLESHRPVDLLPDRESATVANWLSGHPFIEVVCRDRAGAYAEAANIGAAQAIQVADRWHLWHNLGKHVEKTVAQHRRCLTPPPQPNEPVPVPAPAPTEPTAAVRHADGLAARARQRFQAVHELVAAGANLRQICRELDLSRGTVRRFARATTVDELLPGQRHSNEVSMLGPFAEHLRQRWGHGITNATALLKEIRALGYTGGSTAVREYVRPWRSDARTPQAGRVKALSARHLTGLLMRNPDDLDADEVQQRQDALNNCVHLDRLAEHVSRFAAMLVHRHGECLDSWLADVEADDQPHLQSFVSGITSVRVRVPAS